MRRRAQRAATFAFVAATVACVCVCACTEGSSASASPTAKPDGLVTFHAPNEDVTLRVEIRDTPDGRARGLMYRRELAESQGMVFIFARVSEHPFWMKNTYLPLDMIFVDPHFTVVGVVHSAEPMTETSRTVGLPSKYVVETIAGFAKKHGITRGTRVTMENVPATAAR